ncbi:MAG: translation initiation factor IF-3 [Clostridia bacterium]
MQVSLFFGGIVIKEQATNHEIAGIQVRLIGEQGEQLGIISAEEANRMAEQAGVDLVMIAPNGQPPVCKLMDYNKFKFEQAKKLKDQRKNQKIVKVKEMSLSMTIDTHDLETKANNVKKFLAEGDKVKVSIRMRGRQQARPEIGVRVCQEFAELVKEYGTVEKAPSVMDRNIIMFIAPLAKK